MQKEAINNEKKYRIIIYHGHLHRIPIDEIKEDLLTKKVASKEESNKLDTF
jgi:hypothetical protein